LICAAWRRQIEFLGPAAGQRRSQRGWRPRRLLWDRLQQLERLFERRHAALDLYLHLRNGLLREIDVRQELADQHQMMRLDPSVERLAQLRQLGPQDATGQLGKDVRIPLAIEHGRQHGPAADA
jgi:hypothetical protein